MRQRMSRLLMWNSLFREFIFFLYYSHIIRGVIATMTLINELKNTINGFRRNEASIDKAGRNFLDGGASLETPSYIQATKGVIAKLEENFNLGTAYNPPLKIMPLGDSITYGVTGTKDRDSGGYRTELWNKFLADGLQVEFVGSIFKGADSLSSQNHEGHPGWTIKQISDSVDQWLNTSRPDLILLMIGTNDTKKSSLKTMIEELSALIDKITAHSPDAQLFVASIPPIHPSAMPRIRVLRAIYFNAAIPNIVNSKVAQKQKVDFVDMRSLTINDLTSSLSPNLDNGLHPNAQGYHKIANFWHDAVLRVTSNIRSSDRPLASKVSLKPSGRSFKRVLRG